MFEQLGARWASEDEIRAVGVQINLEDNVIIGAGLPLLSNAKTMNVCDDDTHSLIIGGSGSKKNRLLIFPIIYLLAKRGENLFVCDPKGESLSRTGSFLKKQGYNIRIIDFRNVAKRGDYWNPFDLAFTKYKNGDTNDAQEMFLDFISLLSAPQKKQCNDRFWIDSAEALGAAILPLMAEIAEKDEMNIGSFLHMIGNIELLEKLVSKLPEDCITAINMRAITSSPEKTKSCIYMTLFSMMSMFVNQENLIAALSNSTFSLEEMANEKTALFFITPDEKSIFNAIAAAMIKQMYQVLIEKAQQSKDFKLKHRVNFILDEFCNIPEIPDFTNMISAGRSRNIRFFLVIQSLHQLQSKYGSDESQTIISNCSNWVYLHSREMPLLEMLSRLCGERYMSDGSRRALITPFQLQHLNKENGEALIFCGRLYPYITQLPDIDEYEVFNGYPAMEPSASPAKPLEIISIQKVINEIEHRIRPIPFSGESKKYISQSIISKRGDDEYDDDEIFETLDEMFAEMFEDNE